MKLRSILEVKQLKGRRVLVRADFNVPVVRGRVGEQEDWRLQKVAPTIERLVRAGARVVLASHLGRPEGRKVAALKMDPVAKRLAAILGRPVKKLPDCVGPAVERSVKAMKGGGVVLLENLRFHKGEDANDKAFAKRLARLGDLYVNEAFATSHRAAASIVAVADELPSYAGELLVAEVEALERVLRHPARPYLVMMGGAKISTKIGVIARLLKIADRVLLGGALIAPFYKAIGFCIGSTPCSDQDVKTAEELIRSKLFDRLVLPHDVVVGHPKRPAEKAKVVDLRTEPFDLCDGDRRAVLDIGPKTISAYASYIRSAKTIVWNGPMGLFEIPKYSHGTLALGRLVAARSSGRAYGLVGGGETAVALARTGLMDCVDHVSTGGGAMLEFLEGKKLPGLVPLLH